jgi:light-regulated signal transduction histidine kinase (bacteriophytochrome)
MNIIDIVNRDIVNLENCESEPIHIPGTIQPHGFLLGLRAADLRISYCSDNAALFLDAGKKELLEQDFASFFPAEEAESFRAYVQTLESNPQPFVFTLKDIAYNTTVHQSGDTILLEFEAFPDGSLALPDLYVQTRKFVTIIENVSSLKELCQAVSDETRAITGYDRVMVYRFDKDYNGEVFAESKRAGLEPFLGLKYPHTDIPAQARELYMRNQLRIIVDVDYQPTPIFTTQQDNSTAPLDLSLSVLRSVSPIHIEYLKNMGVNATMNISLIHNRRLWGLIACHHYAPKIVPHYTRLTAKLQGHFLTSQLDVRQQVEEHDLNVQVDKDLSALMKHLEDKEDYIAQLCADPRLASFVHAAGAAIVYDGQVYRNGKTPDDAAVLELADWMRKQVQGPEFAGASLKEFYPGWEQLAATASGILYYKLSYKEKDCIVWFRPEVKTTIDWAGNPDKAVVKSEDGARLSPRKSFERWKEIVQYRSKDWEAPEIRAAFKLAQALEKQMLFVNLAREEDKQRRLAEQLKAANSELRNINWISTHDLREPLRKIQMFSSKIVDTGLEGVPEKAVQSVDKIRQTAARMQRLLDDIYQYSMTSNTELSFETVDLNLLLQSIVQEDIAERLTGKGASITIEALPGIHGIRFQLRQLFLNLLNNSLKFTDPERPAVIRIGCEVVAAQDLDLSLLPAAQWYKIYVSDNGIGFDNQYADRIMGIFQRLHGAAEFEGTGIGLAICKKIVENHGGMLAARGIPGEGATFTIYLPKE